MILQSDIAGWLLIVAVITAGGVHCDSFKGWMPSLPKPPVY